MSKFIHLAAAALLTAIAAASLAGLAAAAPQEAGGVGESCKKALCFVAFF